MIDAKELQKFLIEARINTYAGGKGKVGATLAGSDQLEYKTGNWLYRDVYYTGRGIFMGLETVYFGDKPAWSMSYYGNFKKMSEKEIDRILRKALIKNSQRTRLWNHIEWESENYKYICAPDFRGSMDELAGSEKVFKGNEEVYSFYYAGGLIWKD